MNEFKLFNVTTIRSLQLKQINMKTICLTRYLQNPYVIWIVGLNPRQTKRPLTRLPAKTAFVTL